MKPSESWMRTMVTKNVSGYDLKSVLTEIADRRDKEGQDVQ